MAWDFELVAGPYGGMTDGPLWDGDGLLFSNVQDSAIMRFEPASGRTSVFRPYWIRVRGLARDAAGTMYGCQSGSRRIVRFNADGSASPIRARLDGALHNCPDDLAIDRQGRIWFSDPYDVEQPRGPDLRSFLDHASILRLERTGEGDSWGLSRMTFDTRWPRGVLLSSDEGSLYVTESNPESLGRRELRAYDIAADGSLRPYRVVFAFGIDDSFVDGMCLDGAGNILVCAGSSDRPGAVHVIATDGAPIERCPLPDGQATNCTFGDGALYVTTAEGHLYRGRARIV